MIKLILDKITDILSYSYEHSSDTFLVQAGSDFNVVRDMIEIVNILSEHNIQFVVDEDYNIRVNNIDLNKQRAFVVSLDFQANIIAVNDIALDISGYEKDDLIGQNYFDVFIDKTDIENLKEVFSNVLSGSNNYWKHQNNIILKDGSKKFLHWSNALIIDEKKNLSTIHAFGVLKVS